MSDHHEPDSRIAGADLDPLRQRLLVAVRQICPAWLSAHAEDITQEALLRVASAIEREGERDRELPSSYLRRSAFNAMIDEIRKHRQRRLRETGGGEDGRAVEGARAPGGNPEEAAAGREIGQAIRHCLTRLVRPRRVAAILHLQGHTIPEISRLLGWAETRANNLVYRGVKDLRQCLTEKGLKP